MKSINEGQNNNVVYVSVSYESLRNIANLQTISIPKDVMKRLPEEKITFVQLSQDKNTVNNNSSYDLQNEIQNNPEQTDNTSSIDLPPDGIVKKPQFECPTCKQTFTKVAPYRQHVEFHNNVKKYKCEHCFESYNVEDNFKLHMALHASSTPVCPLCNKKFQRFAGFKSHLLLHQVDETFTCKDCLAEFEKETDYYKHLEKHSTTNETEEEKLPYICSYCNYVFEDVAKYKEHIAHHIKIKKLCFGAKRRTRQKLTDNKDNPHKCVTCGKSFRKLCLLERHLRIHSGERPFACTKCDKRFTQKASLQIHLLKHNGCKPFKCTLCPASFFQKCNLRVHVEKAHTAPRDVTKLYKCKECTCVFKKISTLNAHITKFHTSVKQPSEIDEFQEIAHQLNNLQQLASQANVRNLDDLPDKQTENYVKLSETSVDGTVRDYLVRQRIVEGVKTYLCTYCSKEFRKPSDLIRHLRVHTREKPYVCGICQTAFSLKSVLRSHMNTHLGKKEHQCLVCLQLFSSTKRLNKHLRIHDNSEEPLTLKYKCSLCDKLSNSLQTLEQHMEVHKCVMSEETDPIEKALSVDLKQPLLKTDSNLFELSTPKILAPYVQDENSKKRPFKCHLCPGAFMKSDHLRSHMASHSQEKNYKCDVCDKTFSTLSNLNHHKPIHSTRKFECGICLKKFSKASYLQSHEMQHVNAGNYMCPYCKREFKNVQHCRKHIRTHKTEEEANLNLPLPLMSNISKAVDENEYNLINLNTFEQSEQIEQIEKENDLELTSNMIDEVQEISEDINNDVTYSLTYTNDINPITECNQNYSTIFISCNDEQMDTTAIFDPSLTQTQIETTNPVLGEPQDVNLLFIDPLTSQVELQENQNFEPFNQVMLNETIIPSEINLNAEDINLEISGSIIGQDVIQENTLANIVDVNNSELKINLSDPLLIEHDKDDLKQGPKLILPVEHPNGLKENMYITISVDDLKANNLSYLSNMIGLNNVVNIGEVAPVEDLNLVATNNILITENRSDETITCAVCCEIIEDLANHQCINVLSGDQGEITQSVINENDQEMMETQDNINELEEEMQNIPEGNGIEQTPVSNIIQLTNEQNTISQVDKKKKSTICEFCSKQFRKHSDLQRHVRTHTGERPYKCEKCAKSFSLKSTLLSHMRTHDPADSKITCHICNYSYSCKASLKVHMMIHSGVKPYPCNLCPARFRTTAHRRMHLEKHQNQTKSKKKGTIKSDIKNVLNYTNNYFESMLTTEGQENVGDIQLNDTANIINIDENTKVIATNTIDPSETLNMSDSLHIDILQQLQQFGQQLAFDIEEIQDKTTNQPMIIDSLEANVQPPVSVMKEKTFGCDICGKMYSTKSILKKHQKNHKKYVCSKCRKQFDADDELEKHMKIHMGYRPFSCLHCANSFTEESSLKTHMKRIHNLPS